MIDEKLINSIRAHGTFKRSVQGKYKVLLVELLKGK